MYHVFKIVSPIIYIIPSTKNRNQERRERVVACILGPYYFILPVLIKYRKLRRVPLGSVTFLPAPKIKSLGKYLFSHAPTHTIGNCSSRYV